MFASMLNRKLLPRSEVGGGRVLKEQEGRTARDRKEGVIAPKQ